MAGAYGGLIGGATSLMGTLMGSGQKGVDLGQVHLDPITKGQDLFLEQGKNLPQVGQTLNEANDLSNEMFKKNIAKFAPEVEQTNRAIGQNAEDLLSGNLSLHNNMTGFNGGQLTARDLGITTDDLMGQGVGLAGQSLKGAQALNPFNHDVTSTLIGPGSMLAREDSHKYQANDLANQELQIKSKGDSINPIMSGISGAAGSLMGGMGGGGGGGGIMSMLGGMF